MGNDLAPTWIVSTPNEKPMHVRAHLWYEAREIASRMYGKSPLDIEARREDLRAQDSEG